MSVILEWVHILFIEAATSTNLQPVAGPRGDDARAMRHVFTNLWIQVLLTVICR
jgi:hypothetical protein